MQYERAEPIGSRHPPRDRCGVPVRACGGAPAGQATALRFGQLNVVQPVLITELIFLVAILVVGFRSAMVAGDGAWFGGGDTVRRQRGVHQDGDHAVAGGRRGWFDRQRRPLPHRVVRARSGCSCSKVRCTLGPSPRPAPPTWSSTPWSASSSAPRRSASGSGPAHCRSPWTCWRSCCYASVSRYSPARRW